MAAAVLDQTVSDTGIEQLGGGAPMKHFPHRRASFLVERAVMIAQFDHRQPEDGRKALSGACPFVGKMNRRAIHEQGPHELQLMDVRCEERLRIFTTEAIGTVDHEENPDTLPGTRQRVLRSP